MKTYIVDSYAWVSYFEEDNSRFRQAIEGSYLETPAIVLSEISRVLARKKVTEQKKKEVLEFIKDNSLVLVLTADKAITAGELCEKEGLNLADAIIYSHAEKDKKVLTGDKHFIGKKFAEYVEAGAGRQPMA